MAKKLIELSIVLFSLFLSPMYHTLLYTLNGTVFSLVKFNSIKISKATQEALLEVKSNKKKYNPINCLLDPVLQELLVRVISGHFLFLRPKR